MQLGHNYITTISVFNHLIYKQKARDIKCLSSSDSPEETSRNQEAQKMQQLTLSKWVFISPSSFPLLVCQTRSCEALCVVWVKIDVMERVLHL